MTATQDVQTHTLSLSQGTLALSLPLSPPFDPPLVPLPSVAGPDASCGVRALSLSLNTLPSPHCWPLVLSRLPPSLTTLSLHHISPPPPPLPTPLLQTLTRLDLCPLPSHRTDR